MKNNTIIFSSINLVGLFLYCWFIGGIVHLAKMEQRDYYDGVDGITYFCTAIPVLLFCFLLNAG
jgi:hypothetical protein